MVQVPDSEAQSSMYAFPALDMPEAKGLSSYTRRRSAAIASYLAHT